MPLPQHRAKVSAPFTDCISSSYLNIAYINCVGQSKFPVSKQLEIESYVRDQKLDIIHLQEIKIEDTSFSDCGFIRSNFNIFVNNTSNENYYGTASLVRCDIDVSNIRTDEGGRVLVFDAADCTFGNFYLPSGTYAPSQNLREHYCAEILPNILL